jgi:hypothetical protein
MVHYQGLPNSRPGKHTNIAIEAMAIENFIVVFYPAFLNGGFPVRFL